MGKKQHQSDKMYITTVEWKNFYGGHKDDSAAKLARAKFRRLPFTHCSLSFLPFEIPVCTPEGTIFDFMHILPFLKKHGINPVNGKKLDPKSLIKLKFHKNDEDEFHCPVTYKVFTPNSNIIAIRTSGNVYSYEAYEELNLKPKHFRDLLTDEPFQKKDVIVLQDPQDLDKFNIEKFHHIVYKLNSDEKDSNQTSTANLRSVNAETRDALAQLAKDYKPPEKKPKMIEKADDVNAAHYSQGKVAMGFTSTIMEPVTRQEAAVIEEDQLKYLRVKKKGYVRLITNFGHLNLELYCDQTPLACENFIKHCKSGYYYGCNFHRSIRNFILQGGDPTGTGQGGDSVWGKPFKDEIIQSLSHHGRGVLSMANKGSNTNISQFFITYRSCKHLDGKHTIFGRLVGGFEVFSAIEKLETDAANKPLQDVTILNTQVFVDPFEEAEEQLRQERQAAIERKVEEARKEAELKKSVTNSSDPKAVTYKKGVGKYIRPTGKSEMPGPSTGSDNTQKRTVKPSANLDNFDSW